MMVREIQRAVLVFAVLMTFAVPRSLAVRPFITDDAALIGRKRMEIANWIFINKYSGQFWHSANIGLHDRVELTIALLWGSGRAADENLRQMSFTAPLLQAKFLIRDYEQNGIPGITIAAGTDLPLGTGTFVPSGYGTFVFGAVTQCLGKDENVLIHANIGGTYLRENGGNHFDLIWGIGTQIKIHNGFHVVGELISGDPYIYNAGIGYQLGIRQFINNNVQIDFACGNGIGGNENKMSFWISSGIRYVLSFDKKGNDKYARNGRKILE